MVAILRDYGQMLLTAMGYTMILALYGLFFACIIGLFFGLLSVVKNKFCNAVAKLFVYIIRGIPMIVLAYFVFFGIPYAFKNFLGIPLTFTALHAGTICLRSTAAHTWRRLFAVESSRLTLVRWRLQEALECPTDVRCTA